MFINDRIKTAQLTLPNFAANAAIGTSVATVDLYSSFAINQTTAGRTLTLPVPSDTRAGDRVIIHNIGTVAFTVLAVVISPGTFAHFHWNGAAWIPQLGDLPATGQDFFRTVAGGLLPDGAADTTKAIRRLGGIGLGGALVTDALPTVTGATATNVPWQLSNNAAGRGQLFYGTSPLSYYLERAQSTTADERVNIGTIATYLPDNGGYVVRFAISTSDGNNVVTKYYDLPISWSDTSNAIQRIRPTKEEQRAGDTNDFELLYQVNAGTANFWVRRTAGAVVGIYRIRMEIVGSGRQTFTETTATIVDTTDYPFHMDDSQTTEWLLGTSTTQDAQWNKTGSIWREGRVRIGPIHRVGETVPYDYSTVTTLIGSPTPIGNAVTPVGTLNTDTVLRLIRGGTSGTNYNSSIDFRIGRYFADINARTRVDVILGNAAGDVPDINVMAWLASGAVGIGHNIPFDRLDHRLNIEGAAGSMQSTAAIRNSGMTNPTMQWSGWTHNNNWLAFDGWFDGGNWRASHTTRPFFMGKQGGNLAFYGMAVAPTAAGDVWPLDQMGAWRYAGGTLPGGELWFANVIKNRRIVLLDSNGASDHLFYGFGINASTMRYQVNSTSSAHRWFAATSATTSNEVMSLLGTGRLGVNTPNPLTPGHFQELGAATLPITTLQNADGTLRQFVFAGATPNGILNGRPGDIAQGATSPGSLWVKQTGVNTTTGWVQSTARAFYAATGVTDAAGNVTYTFPAALFSAAPVCAIGIQTALTDTTEARITANSAVSCTINVRRSPAVTILGISVLQVPVNAVGVTVHAIFTVAG